MRQYLHRKEPPREKEKLPIGMIFPPLSEVGYDRTPKTLLVALNVYCKFCEESIPFYQRLAEAQRQNQSSFQMAALFLNKEGDAVNRFVNEKELSVAAIPAVDFSSLGISSTPTIALVDNHGKLVNSWIGELNENDEKD